MTLNALLVNKFGIPIFVEVFARLELYCLQTITKYKILSYKEKLYLKLF